MSDKLKPCPFCGGEACMQIHEFVGYANTYGVVCLDCCVETRQFYDTKEDAIKAWNTRADRKTEPTGYNLSPVEDEPQTEYERASEQREHDIVYEPTYDVDDGSM